MRKVIPESIPRVTYSSREQLGKFKMTGAELPIIKQVLSFLKWCFGWFDKLVLRKALALQDDTQVLLRIDEVEREFNNRGIFAGRVVTRLVELQANPTNLVTIAALSVLEDAKFLRDDELRRQFDLFDPKTADICLQAVKAFLQDLKPAFALTSKAEIAIKQQVQIGKVQFDFATHSANAVLEKINAARARLEAVRQMILR